MHINKHATYKTQFYKTTRDNSGGFWLKCLHSTAVAEALYDICFFVRPSDSPKHGISRTPLVNFFKLRTNIPLESGAD